MSEGPKIKGNGIKEVQMSLEKWIKGAAQREYLKRLCKVEFQVEVKEGVFQAMNIVELTNFESNDKPLLGRALKIVDSYIETNGSFPDGVGLYYKDRLGLGAW